MEILHIQLSVSDCALICEALECLSMIVPDDPTVIYDAERIYTDLNNQVNGAKKETADEDDSF